MSSINKDEVARRKAFVKANHEYLTVSDICEEFDITPSQVSGYCNDLGVKCIGVRQQTVNFILDHPSWSAEKIGEMMGKSPSVIERIIGEDNLRPKVKVAKIDMSDEDLQNSIRDKAAAFGIDYGRRGVTGYKDKYNQSHSPFGYADKLRGIETTGEVQRFYPEIVRL